MKKAQFQQNQVATDKKTGSAIIMESCQITALGIRDVLSQSGGFTWDVRITKSLTEAADALHSAPAQLLIMELCGENDSVLDGLKFLRLSLARWPTTAIIINTAFTDTRILQLLAATEIQGLVLKQEPAIALLQCAQQVIAGTKSFSHKVKQLLSKQPAGSENLTPRELEVLTHLFAGKNVTGTAQEIARNARTVSTHKRNAMHKLGINSDGELYLQGMWMAKTGPLFAR
ncbi:LuxR C-terminal-related transcriptional regulator [Kalamiella sp. sgz302252]|uniref:LuxR C-terminal-related transcriptional regulator n=1 Tax=Pantoea sp. sgz302252 TaxID=3341827 RepID=UPI0036D3FBDF